jgi:ribosome-associated protein
MSLKIPFHEMEFSYVRSRGPGGQNVNRTNSAAILRWNLFNSGIFDDQKKERLAQKLRSRLTESGEILIRSDIHRDQDQNRSECIKKLHELLIKALFIPKKRVATKPTKSSKIKRLDTKKRDAQIKGLRRRVSSNE